MKIKSLVKRPYESAKVKEIENRLDVLQNIVGGYIECPYIKCFSEKGISIIINEEGKLIDLENNIIFSHNGDIIDTVKGNIIFVSLKETEDGIEHDSLSDTQINFIQEILSISYFIDENSNKIESIQI